VIGVVKSEESTGWVLKNPLILNSMEGGSLLTRMNVFNYAAPVTLFKGTVIASYEVDDDMGKTYNEFLSTIDGRTEERSATIKVKRVTDIDELPSAVPSGKLNIDDLRKTTKRIKE
jgi:hypothetical protein